MSPAVPSQEAREAAHQCILADEGISYPSISSGFSDENAVVQAFAAFERVILSRTPASLDTIQTVVDRFRSVTWDDGARRDLVSELAAAVGGSSTPASVPEEMQQNIKHIAFEAQRAADAIIEFTARPTPPASERQEDFERIDGVETGNTITPNVDPYAHADGSRECRPITPPASSEVARVAEAIYLAYCEGARAKGARYELVEDRYKRSIWEPKARAALTTPSDGDAS